MFKRLWLIVRSLLSIAQAPRCFCLKFHLFHLRISFTSDFGPPRQRLLVLLRTSVAASSLLASAIKHIVRLDIITISEPSPERIQRETKRKQSRHLKGDI